MIRILEVLATLKRAGAETMVSSLACGLDRTRFETAIVTLFEKSDGDLESCVERCGVRVFRLDKHKGLDLRIFGRLRRVLTDFQPHVIHTHSYVMRYVLPVASTAIVHTVHNVASHEVDTLGRWVHRAGFSRGVVPIAVAQEVSRSFQDVYGFQPAATIPNGIDASRFYRPEARFRWRRDHGFSTDQILICSVARLEPQKNPGLLIEAFRRLPSDCQLLLAGQGSLEPQFTGIDRVHLLGLRSDLPELLSACDIFALASDWEGYPIAIMEAMAAGLPIVATSVGGVPEVVGEAGSLVPPRDVAQLAAALGALVVDPARRHALGGTARSRAARFDVHTMVEAYSELFERVAARA